MASTGGPAPVSPIVRVTIRHLGVWDQGRHGAAFLRPLVDGVRRRLGVAGKKPPPAGPSAK